MLLQYQSGHTRYSRKIFIMVVTYLCMCFYRKHLFKMFAFSGHTRYAVCKLFWLLWNAKHFFSQDREETGLKRGSHIHSILFCSLSVNVPVKELLKLVCVCASYQKNRSGPISSSMCCV